ncbi:MAG: hypothetical protein EBS27_05390 [Actinobacteria bacterium]|nr:hypothetical protein [Actinomycetota bacterium]
MDDPFVGRTFGEKTAESLLDGGAAEHFCYRHIVVFAVLRHHVEGFRQMMALDRFKKRSDERIRVFG